MSNLSLGETRVRTTFNPSNNTTVDQIKQKSADLINQVNEFPSPDVAEKINEFKRLTALSITAYELAAMWGVKALTI
jgi:hypothetical protein